ncbi:MAG: response regulator, partial [Anaeromyxobacteraceae bacterium]
MHAPRVLVADDEKDIRETIGQLLEYEGYLVSLAGDGVDALRLAREQHPDLILLDLMMPRMNGWQFRAAQLEDATVSGIPVVVVSATVPRDSRGFANALLHKPVSLDDLLDIVRRCTSGACPGAS